MAIIDVQRRLAEVGRIRIGQQVESSNGKTRPAKLDTLRLTSADRRRIEQAAELYGGTAQPWQAPAGQQWEVVTETADVPVIVPPSDMSFSQFYELWTKGGCQRRCDGATEQLSDGPCLCDPEARECKPHSRLSVMLRDLPGLGLWRLDTLGYYAMNELAGAVELIQMAGGQGTLVPARLRVEQRQVTRQGEKGPETRKFPVPVIDLEITGAQLVQGIPQAMGLPQGGGNAALTPGQLEGNPQPEVEAEAAPLTPVPDENQQHEPAPGVAEQMERAGQQRSRRRSQQSIPDPGLPDDESAPEAPQEGAGGDTDERAINEQQRKLLMAHCSQAGLDDDARHDVIQVATHGATRSSSKVTRHRFDQVLVLVEAIELGVVDLRYDSDASPYLSFVANEEAVKLPLDVGKWRERINDLRSRTEEAHVG